MQIHELNNKKLNEVDIAGPGGLLSKIGTAAKALAQPGGVKSGVGALKGQAFQDTDFNKRMQAVKNNAAAKQVAANMQAQWDQYRTTVSPMTQISAQQQAQQQNLKSQLLAKKVSGGPAAAKLPLPGTSAAPVTPPSKPSNTTAATPPIAVGKGQPPLDPKDPADAALIAKIRQAQQVPTTESQQLTEAAGIIQLTDWYKRTIVPKEYAAYAGEYLKDPTIQAALKTIVAAENQPDAARQKTQAPAFLDLVAATSAKSQQLVNTNPQVAAAAKSAAPRSRVSQSGGVSSAQATMSQKAGISPTQLAAIGNITGQLGSVSASDVSTRNYLQALGFNVK